MAVSHSSREYVGYQGASTNGIERFRAAVKRSISDTHIHVSARHLPKYLAEFEYRWNMCQLPHFVLDWLMASFAR